MKEEAGPPTRQITVRLDRKELAELEEIGKGMRPLALNRSEMLTVAVRDYLERHRRKAGK